MAHPAIARLMGTSNARGFSAGNQATSEMDD
ncbi:hypothetical protein X739_17655 [Mesorhizobium sp. LNHC220B00]|nr:hypothetical protein X739_17655 [Mesorhizobium sp. LNHC220B00]ESZ01844.1 hypothetical protein X738_00065 [Mesorhizobium sp. LNHC209A00]